MRLNMAITAAIVLIFIPTVVLAEGSVDNLTALTTDERLSQAVLDQGLTLNDSDRSLITQKCQNSQVILANSQDGLDKIVRQRLDNYTVIQKELLALKLRMVRQGVDASEIDLLIGKIQQGIDNFALASNAYGTTVSDVQSINCAEKPEQFKAGIVLMRAQRAILLDSASSLKRTVRNANETTFNQLKKRLTL